MIEEKARRQLSELRDMQLDILIDVAKMHQDGRDNYANLRDAFLYLNFIHSLNPYLEQALINEVYERHHGRRDTSAKTFRATVEIDYKYCEIDCLEGWRSDDELALGAEADISEHLREFPHRVIKVELVKEE